MTQVAGGHFDGNVVVLGEMANVGSFDEQWQAESGRSVTNEAFIGITATPAQLVIKVSNCQQPTLASRKKMKEVEKHHRIDATRNGYEQSLALAQKMVFCNMPLNLGQQVTHWKILFSLMDEAKEERGGFWIFVVGI